VGHEIERGERKTVTASEKHQILKVKIEPQKLTEKYH
jgi:hypothetical protein